jgi:pimeloyl-[acyl-carrier protein] methyl ester esterase
MYHGLARRQLLAHGFLMRPLLNGGTLAGLGNVTQPVSILLPGLDGTGDLFERFIAAAPAAWPVRALRLPSERPRGYRELADFMLAQLPSQPFALVAESFSGPLAILLANRCPHACAIVLCASFVEAPLPRLLARVPDFFWRHTPPASIVRLLMTGGDRALADAVRTAVLGLDSDVVVGRISAALTADVRRELEQLSQPLLCLQATHDRLVPASAAATIRALKPSATFVTVDGPHLLLQARPTEAWSHIQPFLERASMRGAG